MLTRQKRLEFHMTLILSNCLTLYMTVYLSIKLYLFYLKCSPYFILSSFRTKGHDVNKTISVGLDKRPFDEDPIYKKKVDYKYELMKFVRADL